MKIILRDQNTNEIVVEADNYKDAFYQLVGDVNYGDEIHDILEIEEVNLEEPPEANWIEDYEDNPDHQYVCKCSVCKLFFFGNKGRFTCKVCDELQEKLNGD